MTFGSWCEVLKSAVGILPQNAVYFLFALTCEMYAPAGYYAPYAYAYGPGGVGHVPFAQPPPPAPPAAPMSRAELRKAQARAQREAALRNSFPTYELLLNDALVRWEAEYIEKEAMGKWRARWIGGAAKIDEIPLVDQDGESTNDPVLEMVLAGVRARKTPVDDENEDTATTPDGNGKNGHGCRQLKASFNDMFQKRLWGGLLYKEAFEHGRVSTFLDPADIAKAIHENPKKINKSAVQVMFDTFEAAAESIGIESNDKSHQRRWPVPSANEVGEAEKVVLDAAEALFARADADRRARDPSTAVGEADEEERVARESLKHYWRVDDVKRYVECLFRALKVDKICPEKLRRYPYQVKLVNDGAPTTKLRGCVTLTLSIVDPRTNDEIRYHPQLPKYCFPLACFFDKETKLTIKGGFAGVYRELRKLERDGVLVGDVRVPVKMIDGNDLSNVWKGTVGCGGAIGTSHHPCTLCSWNVLRRSLGQPGGAEWCRRKCRPGCHHYDIFGASGGAALVRMRAERDRLGAAMQTETVPGKTWFERVRRLTMGLDAAQRAARAIGIATDGKTFTQLQAELDIAANGLLLSDGFDDPAQLVADLDVDEVHEQLGMHNMPEREDETPAAARARLAKRVADVQVIELATRSRATHHRTDTSSHATR